MNIILSLPCDLEDVPRKLQILMRDDISKATRCIEEVVYGSEAESAARLMADIERVRGFLLSLDERLQSTTDLLREQQKALLGSTEPEDAHPRGMDSAALQQALEEYDTGVGLPTGSE